MHRLKRIRLEPLKERTHGRTVLYLLLTFFLILYLGTIPLVSRLTSAEQGLKTVAWHDRNGKSVQLKSNEKGHFVTITEPTPPLFEKLLLQKEDRYFYYHLGVNPVSMVRGFFHKLRTGKTEGSSTITQQLVKVLLGNEGTRTLRNKFVESLYAVALELHTSKRDILSLYEEVAYFGKSRQGVTEASLYFFNKKPTELNEVEILSLITALGSPSTRFPGSTQNEKLLPKVISATESDLHYQASTSPFVFSPSTTLRTSFELKTLGLTCDPCNLTVDALLTEKIRNILRRKIESESRSESNVTNGAIVVIKLPENELLVLVGTPDPTSLASGAQINMAIEPRPIGSTAKAFIYLAAFAKGARPYTLVNDEEYSYTIGTSFAFYPKNFDGRFRGAVTLHNALSNSLNVPAVKTLEYVGLSTFYTFLRESLGFTSLQPLERYELGIALGALEMDLLTLSHFFTIFPNEGVLKPLTLERTRVGGLETPMEKKLLSEKRVAEKSFVQLVNKILSDREMAVEQFGLRSNLTLPYKNYALKTGTSRDYHDSWTIGYTPDFLVGVWLGNSDNTAMRELTGQTGAGAIWQDVMTLMYTSPYNHATPFNFDRVKEFTNSASIEYGLAGDTYDISRNLFVQPSIILSPHDGDRVELTPGTVIQLLAREDVDWFIDNTFKQHAKSITLSPKQTKKFHIEARTETTNQRITIFLVNPN